MEYNDILRQYERYIDTIPVKTKIRDCVHEILGKGNFNSNSSDYYMPVKRIEAVCEKKMSLADRNDKNSVKKRVVAGLAAQLIKRLPQLNLPNSIQELYPKRLVDLYEYLNSEGSAGYDIEDDFYCKDTRFVMGLSIPCGAQVVDKISLISPVSAVLAAIRSKQVSQLYNYVINGGYGKWFRIHTDIRFLEDFNENGWDRCYIRVADLLKKRAFIKGMVGTSWFYDPNVTNVSPRLSYLLKNPMERGAFVLKHRTDSLDIKRATSKSKTRKRLYKEGKYTPVSYSLLWPRDKMIEWSNRK